MPYVSTAFRQLLAPLDRRLLARTVAKHDGNHGVGESDNAWTCQCHLKALLFAQFSGLKSLREIEQGLAARPEALYHLGLRLPKRSTLSDASLKRPSEVFRDLLMGAASRRVRREGRAITELIDASPIPLRDPRFTWPETGDRTRGLKLYVHYLPNEDVPVAFDLSSPKMGDTTLARTLATLQEGTTYVFDKGFDEYAFWQHIVDAKALFVTRLKKNAKTREAVSSIGPHPAPVMEEFALKVGGKRVLGGVRNPLYDTPLREVVVARPGEAPLRLITNDLVRPVTEIADLYKQRWQIELFFKWIKQNLKVKAFLGRSENAVKIQLYIAAIAFLLLRIAKDTIAKAHKGSLKDFMARVGVALLSPVDLTGTAKPPPRRPGSRAQTTQFTLQFATLRP